MTGKEYVHAAADLVAQYHESIRHDFESIDESKVWKRPVPGQSSPANLVLHLSGNLRHFFGHVLGGSGYVRNRDREFLDEPYASKAEILKTWEEACTETRSVLGSLDDAALMRTAPLDGYPGSVPNHHLVLRLLTHFTYHGGQIRSMSRLLSS
jgi:uncharacterized damage-inducible protein DinB